MESNKEIKSLPTWQLTVDTFDPKANLVQETLFALGNGYIGLRGTHEEKFDGFKSNSLEGTFINGFYESSPMHHPEPSYALAKENQFMLNVPNAKGINFSIGDENFDLFEGKIIHYNRSIDFRTGVLSRNIEWTSPDGKTVSVTSRRLISFVRKNLFAIEYEIKSVDFAGVLSLKSTLDGQVKNVEAGEDLRLGIAMAGQALQPLAVEQEQDFSALVQRTTNSRLMLVSAIENDLVASSTSPVKTQVLANDQKLEQSYQVAVKEGDTIRLTKYGAYFTSSNDITENQLFTLAKESLKEARKQGFTSLRAEQKEFLSDFWHYADIQIEGNEALEQGLHFSQFHLLQSIGRDGKTSIAAKGLTGEGYGGHYFWDAEIYAFPFYLYTRPKIARSMLEYRYSILDKARERAIQMSHKKGALYTWRTIAGEECSGFFPAGTAQYHINADIAYAVKQYYEATNDDDFMRMHGAEMVIETARVWRDIGAYIENKNGQFCINGVTGPDEYTAIVNNNFYTNAMAQMHLRFAAQLASKLKTEYPDDFQRIAKKVDLSENEPKEWLRAADSMYLLYDEKLGIHPQDDSFLSKEIWHLNNIPEAHRHDPLFLNYHYLVIYRYQICKQADVVLAMFLLGDKFTLEDKRRNYDYYEAITTHHSSLSPSTFSVMASEVGHYDKAYQYFTQTTRGDLDNLHGNTSHGVHIAAMGGAWMSLVNGFAGMRAYEGHLQFAPHLPEKWQHYGFGIYFQSKLLQIDIDAQKVQYRLLEGDNLEFKHHGIPLQLSQAAPVKVMSIIEPYSDLPLIETNGKQPEKEPLNKAALSK